ncbi:MAG: efflux RND transporter periplasmic adaptor subunit [Bacteroidales bacterium]|nr:efflux RND transporter periplasmic adaptor subunit [Bacteroidales bacterium]
MNAKSLRRSSLVGVLILIIAFIAFKKIGSVKQTPQKDTLHSNVLKVDVMKVKNQTFKADININGRLVSKQKIEIFTEVTGRLKTSDKPFKDGTFFKKGEPLLSLVDTDYRMNLNATRSSYQTLLTQLLAEVKIEYPADYQKWTQYIDDFDPTQVLPALPEIDNQKEKTYLVAKNVYTQFFNIKAQEAQLEKYTIYAPFDGVLSETNLNPNTLIRAGQKIGAFIAPHAYELEVGVSLAEIAKINLGDKVQLKSNDISGAWTGIVSRIGESIDEKTLNFNIYIDVKSDKLFEGMYLEGIIDSYEIENVAQIPSNLIFNSNEVYTVVDSSLNIVKVEPVHENKNYALVRGLADETLIVSHAVSNAYEGIKVTYKLPEEKIELTHTNQTK